MSLRNHKHTSVACYVLHAAHELDNGSMLVLDFWSQVML